MNGTSAFDPALARGATREVPCGSVVDLLPLTHAGERVAAYRAAMVGGARFPPIAVLDLGGRHVIADGHKRFTAYAGLGRPTIVVEVWGPGRFLRDQWRQVGENAAKNRAILAALFRDPGEAWRLARTTGGHWRRVAASLWRLARGG
jgi:hypothetical protein